MKLETLFEKFDEFAGAPDALAKMRELIMWSAFSGALSTEKRDRPIPEEWAVEGAPTLPAIPSSWKWQRGNEVFDVIRGVSYKKNDVSDSPVEGYFPVLRANNIGNGINFDGLVYVPRDNIREEQFVRRGDILIAMSSGSKKLVGKAAPILTDFIGAFGAFCGIIRNKSAIPNEVLARYFQSPQYTSWVTAAGRGIGINNLGRGDLDSLPVPTPPLAEQKRIVAKVDELMELCDQMEKLQTDREELHAALARASLTRFAEAPTPANLEFIFHKTYDIEPADLRKSILTLAVQGKLVPQDSNDEPAEVLFARIQGAQRRLIEEKKIKRVSVEPNPKRGEFDLLPPGWMWTRLGNTFDVRDGTHATPKYVSDGFPLITSKNIYSGRLLFDGANFISEQDHRQICERSRVDPGDILFAMIGSIGNPVIVDTDREFSIKNVALFKYYVTADAEPRFLLHYLKLVSEEMRARAAGGVQSFVSLGYLRDYLFPLPPLAEQRRIVAKVDELMALVDELETQIAASRTTGKKLLEAMVQSLLLGQDSGETRTFSVKRDKKSA